MSLHNFTTNIPVAKRDISVWIIVMDQPTDKNSDTLLIYIISEVYQVFLVC